MKICRKCKQEKEDDQFYSYCLTRCKQCKVKYALKYQKDNPEKVKQYERKRTQTKALYQSNYYKEWYAKHGRKRADNYLDIIIFWRKNNPEKIKVMDKVYYLVKKGLINRPLECSICGRKARIYAHHEDYTKPFEIIWVCGSCHKNIHLGKISVDN